MPLGPEPWRLALIALCALIFCSCRGPAEQMPSGTPGPCRGQSLPSEAYTGRSGRRGGRRADGSAGHGTGRAPALYADAARGRRREFVSHGPKTNISATAATKAGPPALPGTGEFSGLEMEDAVAHYDTLDGRTVVEPSNEVYIYSPRFGAVRQVVGLVANEERQRASGVHLPEKLDTPTTLQIVAGTKQNVQPGDEIGARPPVALRSKQGGTSSPTALGPRGFQDGFKPYENLAIIRQGIFKAAEMPFLARGATGRHRLVAHSGGADHSRAARGDGRSEVRPEHVDLHGLEPPGSPKLRLVKVASTPFAKPGERSTSRFASTTSATSRSAT